MSTIAPAGRDPGTPPGHSGPHPELAPPAPQTSRVLAVIGRGAPHRVESLTALHEAQADPFAVVSLNVLETQTRMALFEVFGVASGSNLEACEKYRDELANTPLTRRQLS